MCRACGILGHHAQRHHEYIFRVAAQMQVLGPVPGCVYSSTVRFRLGIGTLDTGIRYAYIGGAVEASVMFGSS